MNGNHAGVWKQIHAHAHECFLDASCHIVDLPPEGKYAMVHISSPEETMAKQRPSTMRWSLVINEDSAILSNFPKRLRDCYLHMNGQDRVAVFIHLQGPNTRTEYWGVHLFRKH